MDIEKLFADTIESEGNKNEIRLFEALLDHWVYFYFHETDGRDTKPGKGNIDVVIFTGKDNPIIVPMVENEIGRNGVVYTNSDLALRMAQFDCKVAKMRGIKAFELFYATKDFGGLYIQADYGHIHLNKAKVAEVMGKNAYPGVAGRTSVRSFVAPNCPIFIALCDKRYLNNSQIVSSWKQTLLIATRASRNGT